MTVQRMCELGHVSQLDIGSIRIWNRLMTIWTCATRSSASLWSSLSMAGRGSPSNSTIAGGRDRRVGASCGRTIYFASGDGSLWWRRPIPIRLEMEFIYLAVVLDAFSRRVIGWALDRHLEDDLAIAALEMAFRLRNPPPGLTHHSDRGVQYASNDYTGLLKQHDVRISMSRKGNPYDNATCESFMKTLKYEEVYRQSTADLADARACIQRFLEKVYNGKRLHSALGYRPPVEFENSLLTGLLPPTSKSVTA